MDVLHGMLRNLSTKAADSAKPAASSSADHTTVFREFLAHLDRVQAQPRVKALRAKPAKAKPRRSARR
jgi:hypothetical protein